MKPETTFIKEVRAFVRANIKDWRIDAKEFGEAQLTIGTNKEFDSWNYQTGDNSFTGGAYSYPYWLVAYIDKDSTINNVMDQLIAGMDHIYS